MTNAGTRMAVAGVAFYLAAGGAAEAAKGVKKVDPTNAPANAQRTTAGVVLSVNHKNGSASFHLRTAQHHKKSGAVNPVAVAAGNQHSHNHEFNVTAATRFGHQNGTPASFASLHRGERVRVQAEGHEALAVQIFSQHHTRGSFTRYRANNYHPHLVQQRPHRRR
jgi:hypothetical protein